MTGDPGERPGESRLFDFFDDLEQQAEGLALAERDVEVVERSRAEYAQVDLAGRLHASVGMPVRLGVAGVGSLDVTVSRVGRDWCTARSGSRELVLRLAAITRARGLSPLAVGKPARPLSARLGIGSPLRLLAESRSDVAVHLTDGSVTQGRVLRVGADFVEVAVAGAVEVVSFGALAAVRSQ
jgi:hypothetical protein